MNTGPDLNSTGSRPSRAQQPLNDTALHATPAGAVQTVAAPGEVTGPTYIRGSMIAAALGLTKKTIHARALREGWPWCQNGNRYEYQPPDDLVARCLSLAPGQGTGPTITVRFPDLAHSSKARATVLWREQAVQAVLILLAERRSPIAKAHARAAVVADFSSQLAISIRSLERWEVLYHQFGLDGLVDQKRGRVGKKPLADLLTPDEILKGRALALDHGFKGRVNVARAARQLAADPQLGAGARTALHGAHASKSYVAPSLRKVLGTDPFTAGLVQIGAKHARLNSRWTPCDYSDGSATDVFTADDMTANCYVWTEWQNEAGYIVARPQILAILHCGSLAWMNIRVIMRATQEGRAMSSYSKDDVWGLCGHFFDELGLPGEFLFEGGIWRSNVVLGHKTGLDDDSRFGGLQSLGVKLRRSLLPRSKPIEGMFNLLQSATDGVRGYSGRDERNDKPEYLESQLRLCRERKAHPREFFMHQRDYVDHVHARAAEHNDERQDGKICGGLSPSQKLSESPPAFRQMPDNAKWLYRDSYRAGIKVGANGICISQGSGVNRESFYYDNPELIMQHKLQGHYVAVYWSANCPEADAILFTVRGGRPVEFLGVATRVKEPSRYAATPEELKDERARKSAAMRRAVAFSRTVAPFLKRPSANLVSVDAAADRIGHEIAQSRDRAASAETSRADVRRELAKVEVTREDLGAALERGCAEGQPQMSADEIANLFSTEET